MIQECKNKSANPNSNSKQVEHSSFFKKTTNNPDKSRMINTSMEREEESESKTLDEEKLKRIKIQEQILFHLRTGTLPKDSIINPIVSNDGQVRQYI